MVFLLAHIVPGDPVQQMLGEGRARRRSAADAPYLGLDMPVPCSIAITWRASFTEISASRSDFSSPSRSVVLSHYPATLELAFVALLVCAADRNSRRHCSPRSSRGTPADHAVGVFTLLGLSVPNFALGPVLILVFSVILGWLPVSGRGGLSHLILPAITLGAALAAILTRMVRNFRDRRALQRLRPHRSRQRASPSRPCSSATRFATR